MTTALHTKVYLITGFLGSGKTTLLNRIIARFPRDRKLTILMNEFGEIGIDGTLVEGDAIDMLEISRGSIFCVCVKTDFIKGLYELNTKVKPDILLMESTGVANPSDLKRDLQLPIFNDRFQFKEQFCILDAVHFQDAFEAYASLEKQIASSTVFIINKVDLAPREAIDRIRETVARFHPDPVFFECTYADIPLEQFFFEDMLEGGGIPASAHQQEQKILTAAELDTFIDDLLDQPDLEITPPDALVSVTYRWTGDDIREVEAMAENLPPSLVRAKGFIEAAGRMYIFNYVMGDWTIEEPKIPAERIKHRNVVVFIGPIGTMEGISRAAGEDTWSKGEIVQPGG
ncbi:MAG: GTP-binding protein [Deltaproteobacteria bacterium]|jgi:G3E family GTPase|nr:GTP-binding protein [Deltaproteobacteria bacterium]